MFSVGWWNCLRRIKRHCVKPCPNSFSILLLRISRQSWDVGKGIDVFKVLLSDLMSKAILPASNLIEKSCQKHLTKMVSSVQLHDRMHITVWVQVRDVLWSTVVGYWYCGWFVARNQVWMLQYVIWWNDALMMKAHTVVVYSGRTPSTTVMTRITSSSMIIYHTTVGVW